MPQACFWHLITIESAILIFYLCLMPKSLWKLTTVKPNRRGLVEPKSGLKKLSKDYEIIISQHHYDSAVRTKDRPKTNFHDWIYLFAANMNVIELNGKHWHNGYLVVLHWVSFILLYSSKQANDSASVFLSWRTAPFIRSEILLWQFGERRVPIGSQLAQKDGRKAPTVNGANK